MRIAFGAFQHEANSFCPQPTTMDSFRLNWLKYGDELLSETRGAATEDNGALTVFRECADCQVIPLLGAKAGSGAAIEGATYRALRDDLLQRLQNALPVDGLFLVLHGAMMAEGVDDASGDLLARARELLGPTVPIVATLDLHANVTSLMVRSATALIGYHTAPHIDLYETGQKGARILVETLRGHILPTMALVRMPLIVPAENARHTDGPLSGIINRALELEQSGAILHGGISAVQPWLDAPDVGGAVVIVTDNQLAKAQQYALEMGTTYWQRRADFIPELFSPANAVQQALAGVERTVVLCDSADAPSSGSTGDSDVIVRALLAADLGTQIAMANVVDPAAVAAAFAAGVGQNVTVQVGGALAPQYFTPVTFTGYVKSLHDGEFRFKGQGMRGVVHRMGRTAVLVQGGIRLVVMEHGITQWDPELYRSLGLEPNDARIVQVKSPAAFRAAYKDIADEIIIVDAPGAASPKLTALPWQRLGRPIYPLDDVEYQPHITA
jgi:microcystin degradation protein MlrC